MTDVRLGFGSDYVKSLSNLIMSVLADEEQFQHSGVIHAVRVLIDYLKFNHEKSYSLDSDLFALISDDTLIYNLEPMQQSESSSTSISTLLTLVFLTSLSHGKVFGIFRTEKLLSQSYRLL